jgi:peptide-methionine (R)-S-oxide reductase
MRTILLLLPFIALSCVSKNGQIKSVSPELSDLTEQYNGTKVVKTDAEWKKILTEEQFNILRKGTTECSFTAKEMLQSNKSGVYCCAGCNLPLFSSDAKFNSGTGWPSFFETIFKKNVGLKKDNSHGMERVEVLCNRCDGHLGHVFEDGPAPTGLRYCINGIVLNFVEKK